ncbi:FtsX-like permease family protein [Candidatus Margulisiibacteriota bacterium]
MSPIISIAFNNFIKQRRRNFLLGVAIAFGVMVLTLANSFSRGISDNLLNKVIIFMSGHMKVNVIEQSRYMAPIIRDREKVVSILKKELDGVVAIYEDIGAFGRAVGNSKGDYVYIIGTVIDENFKGQFSLIKGDYENFDKSTYPNPVIMSKQKAEYLKLKIGDQIRIRIENVNGQYETGIMTLAAIAKSQNMFMDYAIFTKQKNLKKIMGYKEYETGALKIVLEDPKTASEKADKLHKALNAETAYIYGKINNQSVVLLPFRREASGNIIENYINVLERAWDLDTKGVIINSKFAKKLGLENKKDFKLDFDTKYEKAKSYKLKIASLAKYKNNNIPENIVFVKHKDFFRIYNYLLPKNEVPLTELIKLPITDSLWQEIAKEYVLLERTKTTKEFTKKMKEVMKTKKIQPTMDVATMYETASQVIKMEKVFNIITTLAGAILFFIIMIGVLNSLRMMIRDRTREIGTMRALGMRKISIRNLFLLEMLFLAIASWVAGIIIAVIIMKLLALIQFSADNPMNMLMVDRRLYFVTTIGNIIRNFVIVFGFVILTTYFPARKAAQMKPADALRHFE